MACTCGPNQGCSDCPTVAPTRKTLVRYPGGSTILHGPSVSEVEHTLREAIEAGHPFVFLHSEHTAVNALAVNPRAVEAIIAAE